MLSLCTHEYKKKSLVGPKQQIKQLFGLNGSNFVQLCGPSKAQKNMKNMNFFLLHNEAI
jgi:hypothetical protein